MSSIQANNPPESDSESRSSSADRDEPEPSSGLGNAANPRDTQKVGHQATAEISVDMLWDESVAEYEASLGISDELIARAVSEAASYRGFQKGQIGIRITDDESIHVINARHLSHDYPTDVISFPYSEDQNFLEGELVASVETAESNAGPAGWDTGSELLLYIIHGVLHIAGMDDAESEDRAAMRQAEAIVLERLGIQGGGRPNG